MSKITFSKFIFTVTTVTLFFIPITILLHSLYVYYQVLAESASKGQGSTTTTQLNQLQLQQQLQGPGFDLESQQQFFRLSDQPSRTAFLDAYAASIEDHYGSESSSLKGEGKGPKGGIKGNKLKTQSQTKSLRGLEARYRLEFSEKYLKQEQEAAAKKKIQIQQSESKNDSNSKSISESKSSQSKSSDSTLGPKFLVTGTDILWAHRYPEATSDLGSAFGNWIKDWDKNVKQQVRKNIEQIPPFNPPKPNTLGTKLTKFAIIEDFLSEKFLKRIQEVYPEIPAEVIGEKSNSNSNSSAISSDSDSKPVPKWYSYANPLEIKYLNVDFDLYKTPIKEYFWYLSHPIFSDLLTDAFRTSQDSTSSSEDTDSEVQDSDSHESLHYDPVIHGGGLHTTRHGGRLNLHLDYERHPALERKQRKLNIIFFLPKAWTMESDDNDKQHNMWSPEWNGDVQLWQGVEPEDTDDMNKNNSGSSSSGAVTKSESTSTSSTQNQNHIVGAKSGDHQLYRLLTRFHPKVNSAFIFETDESSFHGVPEFIDCRGKKVNHNDTTSSQSQSQTQTVTSCRRDTINYYYLSDLTSRPDFTAKRKLGAQADGYRIKATYLARPGVETEDKRLEELFSIRAKRRLEKEDIEKVWPNWSPESHKKEWREMEEKMKKREDSESDGEKIKIEKKSNSNTNTKSVAAESKGKKKKKKDSKSEL